MKTSRARAGSAGRPRGNQPTHPLAGSPSDFTRRPPFRARRSRASSRRIVTQNPWVRVPFNGVSSPSQEGTGADPNVLHPNDCGATAMTVFPREPERVAILAIAALAGVAVALTRSK